MSNNVEKNFSWNSHAIITSLSLNTFSQLKSLQIKSGNISEFLADCPDEMLHSIHGFNKSSKHGKLPHLQDNFLKMFRLNPNIVLQETRLTPFPVGTFKHNFSRLGPPHNDAYRILHQSEFVSAFDVLCTYADEPDWGMDQDLFFVDEYGYGPCPFGVSKGKSSQAPFHMIFMHLNPILQRLKPGLRKSFLPDRIKTFTDLSRVAFRVGNLFWGFRFLAWTIHYLQDVTQPYHATPFPAPIIPIIGRFLRNPLQANFADKNKFYLINRHFLFEGVVHVLLNYAITHRGHEGIRSALELGESKPSDSLSSLMIKASERSVNRAKRIDRTTVNLMKNIPVTDTSFRFVEGEERYIEDEIVRIKSHNPGMMLNFEQLVSPCLTSAAELTRKALSDLVPPNLIQSEH